MPVFENQHAVHAFGNRLVMRYDDKARAQLLIQLKHELQNMFAVAGIEISRWLISKYELRPCN